MAAILLSSPAGGRVVGSVAPGFQVLLDAHPTNGTAPLEVLFNASVSSGLPTRYSLSFGDGQYNNSSETSTGLPPVWNVSHQYSVANYYVAVLTVWEGNVSNVNSTEVVVTAGPLSVSLVASIASGPAPLTVRFTATPHGGTGSYESLAWSFGDGGSGAGADVNYTYVHPGNFTASFTVEDTEGHTANESLAIRVTSATNSSTSSSPEPASPWLPIFLLGCGAGVGGITFATAYATSPSRPRPRLYRTEPMDRSSISRPAAPSAGPAASVAIAPGDGGSALAARPRVDPGVLKLSQRVILHLYACGILAEDDVAPPSFTQGGMAAALGARQNALGNVLRRLVASGLLLQDVRHVSGQARRLKVYRLTPRGENLARDLRRRGPNGERGPTGPRSGP